MMLASHAKSRMPLLHFIRPGEAPKRRRASTIIVAIINLCVITAFLNFDIMSNKVRKLCRTVFKYPDWDQYWEDLFAAKISYDSNMDTEEVERGRQLISRSNNNIGYFLSLVSCPDDSYPAGDPYDPGHAFFDAAAVLKHSIHRNTYPADSKYNATFYAIVHPKAVMCMGPNGKEYDRVQVLSDLGYKVTILGSPIYPRLLTRYLKENVNTDAGERDFMKLHSLTYENHPAIVLVDFTTLMMKPLDDFFDTFISDTTKKISFSYDYPANLPNTGRNVGVNTHWIVMKPDPLMFKAIAEAYRDATYDPNMGWNMQGIKDFKGVLGLKGFLVHYFTRLDKGSHEVLSRCHYANENIDPYGIDVSGERVCRDPLDCNDCRETDFKSIKIMKMTHSCGKPWECHYDESWDPMTRSSCENFHRSWLSVRVSFEETCWEDGPPSYRTGLYKPDVFLGYCSCSGISCYDRMLDDKPAPKVCDTDTQTNSQIQRMNFPNGAIQDQKLSVTSGQVTGSTNACINGTISLDGMDPPYNFAFVIDVSKSTNKEFKGNPVGDLNLDDSVNTILDAEIAAVTSVLDHIVSSHNLGNQNVNIGLISFSSEAKYHGTFTPSDPSNPSEKNPLLMAELQGLRSFGFTHFDLALSKALNFFNDVPKDRNNFLIFLSDGVTNIADDNDIEESTSSFNNKLPGLQEYSSQLSELDTLNVKRMSFGIGSNSDMRKGSGLDNIDNTPDPYTGQGPVLATTIDVLKSTLFNAPLAGELIEFSITVNGMIQPAIDNSHILSGPTGYTFGQFVVTGFDPRHGILNSIKVKAVVDLDGLDTTTDDQVHFEVENLVPGTLFYFEFL